MNISKVPVGTRYGFRVTISETWLKQTKTQRVSMVKWRCDCGREGQSQVSYLKGKLMCVACSSKLGAAVMRTRTGPASSSWKGGRHKTSGGYVVVKRPGHPRADSNGYVLEHVLVMGELLGRPVEPWETVHHINGITDDNHPENLQLRIGRHGKGAVYACADCGSHRITPVALPDLGAPYSLDVMIRTP